MKRAYLLILFCAFCAFPMMAYESPITEPGADNPTEMYTTTNAPAAGPHRISGPAGGQEGLDDPGEQGPSPVGAPWVLLGFAAAYGVSVAIKRRKE
ncbi:MAG: hypothetical protein MJZ84_06745 [Paludibacteraceae bacterium]|nr:hypothetical protein [Paludibacteraceae bacterium]